jgi:hypothetical protein
MRDKDKLQLVDVGLIRHILAFDREAAYEYIAANDERLKDPRGRVLNPLYVTPAGPEARRRVVYSFWDEEPGFILQGLINDACFFGECLELNFWASRAYLDSPLSTETTKSTSLIPQWEKDSDAYFHSKPFDLLEAKHLRLMADAMKKNQDQIDPEKCTDYLKLELFAAATETSSTTKAAYIWDVTRSC